MFILPGIPLVSVTYLAIWTFIDVLPSTCKDISSRLDSLKDKLANYCRFLNINATVQFTYSFVAFQVFLLPKSSFFPKQLRKKKPRQSKQILRHRTLKDEPGSNNFKLLHQHFSLFFSELLVFLPVIYIIWQMNHLQSKPQSSYCIHYLDYPVFKIYRFIILCASSKLTSKNFISIMR